MRLNGVMVSMHGSCDRKWTALHNRNYNVLFQVLTFMGIKLIGKLRKIYMKFALS